VKLPSSIGSRSLYALVWKITADQMLPSIENPIKAQTIINGSLPIFLSVSRVSFTMLSPLPISYSCMYSTVRKITNTYMPGEWILIAGRKK
jgi:hypothetical protein